VTTFEATRNFGDGLAIAHGLRHWYDQQSVLRQEGQRVSRHYYDLHCLFGSIAGNVAFTDGGPGTDCARYVRTFLDRPNYDFISAARQVCDRVHGGMIDGLRRGYENTTMMIFGAPHGVEKSLASAGISRRLQAAASNRQHAHAD
jgi:hypothetical protein